MYRADTQFRGAGPHSPTSVPPDDCHTFHEYCDRLCELADEGLPVLIGPQGIGKSTVGRVLAGDDWFSDSLYLGQAAKETIEQSEGFWIMEIAELAGLSKREHEEISGLIEFMENLQ